MGGRRACVLTKRSQGAVEGVGKSAPVVLVTSIGSLAIGHWVTAALPLGVRVVVIEGLSVPAGAHGAPPWAIGLRAPPRNEVNPGGSRDTHTRQTHEPHKPTSKPTPPTDPGLHAPDHTANP